MLEAKLVGTFGRRYDMVVDGRVLTTWQARWWRNAGAFALDGRDYLVQTNFWGTEYTMTDAAGVVVAVAQNLRRKNWSVTSGGQTYTFRRTGFWRSQEELQSNGQTVGVIRRASGWRNAAAADLPGLPLLVQIFTVGVVVTMWASQQAAAAASA